MPRTARRSSSGDDIESRLPLKPADFHILLTLVEEERHGYAILQSIAAITDGAMRLDPGNLYRRLRRLLADGLVDRVELEPSDGKEDERRRYYRLTDRGHQVAAAEQARLKRILESAPSRALAREEAR